MTRRLAARAIAAALFVMALVSARPASAHRARTAYLDVVEQTSGVAIAHWQLPTDAREATPRFAARCRVSERSSDPGATLPVSQRRLELDVACPGGLGGSVVGVDGLGAGVSAVVLHVMLADGSESSHVLTKQRPEVVVPVSGGASAVGLSFFRLGVEHIFAGIDHLLFVLALVWLAREKRRIVTTISAFTVAHSASLAATALGWLRIPPAFAEACIAVSLVLVACDVGRAEARSHPAWTAGAFGLVHGLGFAGALGDIGLPKNATLTALVSFNLGVEAGQLVFVAACLLVAFGARRFGGRAMGRLPRFVELASAYAVGSLGVFFALARVHALVRP